MSWDQQAYSFGTPNAQPPTPTQTPTSAQFPNPLFETPRNSSNFENRSGWTPTFAEEISVFNATPGRLTGEHHSFVDISAPGPQSTSVQDRRLSGDLGAELSTHVHHLSPNPGISLTPVDTANQLSSSPDPYQTRFDDSAKKKVTPRKPRKRLEEAFSGQTATPPQSASKGSRKLAPKNSSEAMQNESQDSHYGISSTPTQNVGFTSFPSSSADLFGFPLSAPATAPVFTNTKTFWDPDSSMGGMDLDFTADDANMFATGSHKISNSFDWGRNNEIFQESMNVPQNQDIPVQQPAKRQRPLAPKAPRVNVALSTSLPPFEFNNNTNHVPAQNDPFSAVSLDGSVDPGLLFSRNNSASMSQTFEDISLPAARPGSSHIVREPYQHQLRESRRDQEELRRSRNSRENSAVRRLDRGTVSSPIKGSARPGLQRSVSDGRGKKAQSRIMPRTGRSSPVKQARPSSLTSIPESPASRPRTEVIFTIDSKGKARTETIIVGDQLQQVKEAPASLLTEEWDSSSEHSSTDEEPIIIPSRNTSFNLPPQPKGPKLTRFETSNRGADVRRHSASASGYSQSESSSQHSMSLDGPESEAETVMEEDDGSGDATRELRKVMEKRKKDQLKQGNPRHHRYASDSRRYYNSSTNISPTTVTDPDGATPSSTRSGTTRCICGNHESEGVMMILCESCEFWLHMPCVNIDESSLPPVYVCAFCAQTPNMRGGRGRIREPPRATSHLTSSPLAHKSGSFKSFR